MRFQIMLCWFMSTFAKVMKINNKMSVSLLILVTQHLASSQQLPTFDVTVNYDTRAL